MTMDAFLNIQAGIERDPSSTPSDYSGALRELSERGVQLPIIRTDNFNEIIDYVYVPKKPLEKLEKILLYIHHKTSYLFEDLSISRFMTPIGYANHQDELENLLSAPVELGYLEGPQTFGSIEYHLTLSGFEQYEKLRKSTESDQCFVAMWFNDEMMEIFRQSIKSAVKRAGYKALVISMKEHNEDITDHIIAEIRKSRFVIADFTGLRGGVYYEAGFTAGFGKPVIYTCRKDWFNTAGIITKYLQGPKGIIEVDIEEPRFVHFDLSHMNFIFWENAAEFENRLYNRIVATIV
jgi:nucleoside 2-deoxyribosyltransferase